MVRFMLIILLLAATGVSAETAWQPVYKTVKTFDGKDIRMEVYTTPVKNLYQKQRIGVLVRISSPDRYFSIRTDPLISNSLVVQPYKKSRLRDRNGRHVLTTGLDIHPLTAGNLSVQFPPLHYNIGGRERLKFVIPALSLKINPLPEYLPPGIPVGRFSVSSSVKPGPWLLNNRITYLQVSMQSNHVLARWLPGIGRFMKSDDNINYLHHETRFETNGEAQAVNNRKVWLIPFKILSSGKTVMPVLDLRWFDPATGKINRLVYRTPAVYSIAWYWLLTAGLLVTAAVLKLAVFLVRHTGSYLKYLQAFRQACDVIESATSAEDVARGLRMHSQAQGWPVNRTPQGWHENWVADKGSTATLADIIDELTAGLYGQKTATDIDTRKASLLAHIRSGRNSLLSHRARDFRV